MANKKAIDKDTVLHVARLSRINLSDKEVESYRRELVSILDYINQLRELDTEGVPPTSHPLENLKNVFRKDAVKKSLPAEEALKNAPKRKGDFFSVPKIIE